jgi:DNA-directed RNA polymerase specialized sigma24 family protein
VAARDGDPAAWRALLERYDGVIFAVCRSHRLSAADVADGRQTTWLRAVERLARLRDPQGIDGWLATVARHECLRLLRLAARVEPYGDQAPHHADIGRTLRMPVGSIGPTRRRALERLRREGPVARLAAAA